MFKDFSNYVHNHWIILLLTSFIWAPVLFFLVVKAPAILAVFGMPVAIFMAIKYCWNRWARRAENGHWQTFTTIIFLLLYPIIYFALLPVTTSVPGSWGNILPQWLVLLAAGIPFVIIYKKCGGKKK